MAQQKVTTTNNPLYIEKQNYYHRQLLHRSDYNRERDFHIKSRELLTRSLFTKGILSGLEVTFAESGNQLKVKPGLALDGNGTQILLKDEVMLDISELIDSSSENTYLVIISKAFESITVELLEDNAKHRRSPENVWLSRLKQHEKKWKIFLKNNHKARVKTVDTNYAVGIFKGMNIKIINNQLSIGIGEAFTKNRQVINLIEQLEWNNSTKSIAPDNSFILDIPYLDDEGEYAIALSNNELDDDIPDLELLPIKAKLFHKSDNTIILGKLTISKSKDITIDDTGEQDGGIRQNRLIREADIPLLPSQKLDWNADLDKHSKDKRIPINAFQSTKNGKFSQSTFDKYIRGDFYAVPPVVEKGKEVTLRWSHIPSDIQYLELSYFDDARGTHTQTIKTSETHQKVYLERKTFFSLTLKTKESNIVDLLQICVFVKE